MDLTLPGGLRVSVYGLFLLAGLAVGVWRFVRTGHRVGLPSAEALDLGLWVVLAGLVGARAAHVLAHLDAYAAEPLRTVQLWQDGGLAFYGGAVGVAVSCWLLRGRLWLQTLDALAAPVAAGYAVGVLGSLWGGAFPGRPTDLPWAVEVLGTLRHPVAAYLAVGAVAAYRLLERTAGRVRVPGQLALTYLVLQGTCRVAADFFVDPQVAPAVVGPFSLGQVAAAAVAACAAAVLGWRLGAQGGPGEQDDHPGP